MDAHALPLLNDIALCIVFAALASHGARALRQPLILGYVLGGVLLGEPLGLGLVTQQASIELISEIGLILLLFIIGLEINLRELARMGRPMLASGAVQFAGCAALGWTFFPLLGLADGGGGFGRLYAAVALALSSTMIVVKLLHDKFEIHTEAGRLTVGILVLQDIWAIAFMAFQSNLQDPKPGRILSSLGLGVVLVLLAFAASRHLLGRLFRLAGKQPELVLLTAIAWCFLMGHAAEKAGLSKEMGALIAGVSIAAFPYGTDVISKLTGVRDFFVTLFFVSLGLKISKPTPSALGFSLLVGAFVLASRLATVAPAAYLSGRGLRNGMLASLNLSQISEFSLVILALGVGYGHVSGELQALVLNAMLVTSVLSTYLILFNDPLARWTVNAAARLGLRESEAPAGKSDGHAGERRDIMLLGCFRAGEALLGEIERKRPDLTGRIAVVDFNPALREKLEARGYRWLYGDLAHPATLQHVGIEQADLVLCTIPDIFLKGTTNRKLLEHLKTLAPRARFVMAADDAAEAARLTASGAEQAIAPSQLAGERLFQLLESFAEGGKKPA